MIVVMVLSTSAFATDSDPIQRGTAGAAHVATSGPASSFDIVRVGMALVAVIALISALKWGARKYLGQTAPGKGSGAVQILSRNSVGPKQAILLVQVGRRVILVGDSGNQMNALSEISDSDEVAELIGQLRRDKTEKAGKMFGKIFGAAEKDYESADEAPAQDEPSAQAEQVDEMRDELTGLADHVRGLSRQFQKV